MSQPNQMPAPQRISDLKVSGHLMTLQTGLFCIFHTPGQPQPSAQGLPGVRISRSPLMQNHQMEIVTFEQDGWIGAQTGAALVRIHQGPAQVMVTIYQELDSPHEAPRLQVVQLSVQADAIMENTTMQPDALPQQVEHGAMPQQQEPSLPEKPEIGAHIQRQGDVAVRLGEWMGKPGSHAWIEGFGIAPTSLVTPEEIEYQAVLGKGWLSPWVEGGSYCGSRGMALPILGLCVRLKGKAAKQFTCRLHATFTDGTEIGPLETLEPVESPTLAPLEAFLLEIIPRRAGAAKKSKRAMAEPVLRQAEADLADLLKEEETLFERAEEFELSLEDELDTPANHTPPAKQRKAAKPAPSKHKAAVPSKKRGRKPTLSKAQPSRTSRVEEVPPPVKRGRGRPARRAVEHAAPLRVETKARAAGPVRTAGRRRKVGSHS